MRDQHSSAVYNSKVEIRTSSISGQGTFARETIARGEYIMTLTGEPIPADTHRQICVARGMTEDDPLQISEEVYLILIPASRLINHSCEPNAGLRNTSDLFALRDIHPDEEIIYDYSTTVGMEDGWSMPCRCNTAVCRQRVANVLSIPTETLNSYLQMNALPDFIRRQVTK